MNCFIWCLMRTLTEGLRMIVRVLLTSEVQILNKTVLSHVRLREELLV